MRKTIEVYEFIDHQHARVKLLDASAVSWGHLTLMISLEISAVERTYDVHITLMMSDIGEGVGFRSPTIRIF